MKKQYIVLIIILIVLLFNILEVFILQYINFLIFLMIITGESVLVLMLFVVFFYIKGYVIVNQKEMCSQVSNLYGTAEKLLNVFHIFLDNSFLAVKSCLQNEDQYIDFNQTKEFLTGIFLNNSLSKFLNEKPKNGKNNVFKTVNDFTEKIKAYTRLSDNLINMIKRLEDEIRMDALQRIEEKKALEQSKFVNRIAVEYDCVSEIFQELFQSIINNIQGASKPISEEVLVIRKNVKLFIDNVEKWKENLKSDSKGRTFAEIMSTYDKQSKDFNLIYNNVNSIYINFVQNLRKIISMIDKITENSKNIQDIADRTNVLSINASIESSKAGERGKGFRIISNEINKMSEDTRRFVKNIVDVIDDTKIIAQEVSQEFDQSSKSIIQMLFVENREFSVFYQILTDYYHNFNTILNTITELIREINQHVDKFTPIFQVQDISVQAMGNLNNIIVQFLKENKGNIDKIQQSTDVCNKKEIIQRLLGSVEKHITTNDEIGVINKIAGKYKVKEKIITNYDDTGIEIFK